MGLVIAMEKFLSPTVFDRTKLEPLTAKIISAIESLPGLSLLGSLNQRLANTVSFTVAGVDSIALMAALDLEGVCASSGSACSAGSLEPSHVVSALGVAKDLANSLVRFSLGRHSTEAEVDQVIGLLPAVIRRAKGAG